MGEGWCAVRGETARRRRAGSRKRPRKIASISICIVAHGVLEANMCHALNRPRDGHRIHTRACGEFATLALLGRDLHGEALRCALVLKDDQWRVL